MEMEAAIIKILETHGKSIYNFCFYLTGEICEAEDLYQDTILKVWEKRNKRDFLRLFSKTYPLSRHSDFFAYVL